MIASAAPAVAQTQTLHVWAAGSLRAPMTEMARQFEREAKPVRVELVFGASGLLRDRIAAGEAADVFASANMEHPRSLASAGAWSQARAFTRNALCALAPASMQLTPETLVARLLDPAVKVGTSTPEADPSGDYAFEMFARIAAQPGAPADARQRLEAKAQQLTGGPNSPAPPPGRNVYGELLAQGQADVFITYCTNAVAAVAEQPQLRWIAVPPAINVGADYGLTVRRGASPAASAFADFVMSPTGQGLLAKHGFLAVVP